MVETAQIKDHQFMVKVKALQDSRIRVDGIKKDFLKGSIVEIPYSNVNYFRMNGRAVVENTDASDEKIAQEKEKEVKKEAKTAKASK